MTEAETLLAGVGYPFMRDLSLGPVLARRLRDEAWPPSVEVDDYSFSPIGAMHRWQARKQPFSKVVFFAAVANGRRPGTVTRYRYDAPPLTRRDAQLRINEALTGVISLDNLLIIARAFDVLPDPCIVIEVEPADQGWGEGFSDTVEAALPQVLALLYEEARHGESAA